MTDDPMVDRLEKLESAELHNRESIRRILELERKVGALEEGIAGAHEATGHCLNQISMIIDILEGKQT